MSPRKNMKKAEEQHPPAPFAEDDTASLRDNKFEGLSQEVIDKYLAAYDALDNLDLNDDEGEYVNDDASENSQATPSGYEQEQRGEDRFLRSNGNEPPSHVRVNYRAAVQPPQRPPAPPQHNAVPVAPPPTIIFRNATKLAPMAFANVPQALPSYHFDRGIQEALGRYSRVHHRFGDYPEEHYPREIVLGRYDWGVEGMPHDSFFNRIVPLMRPINGIHNERIPFAPPRSLNRDLAPLMEHDLLCEMWADAFGASRRIEEDMAAFRGRLQRLHKFYYRS